MTTADQDDLYEELVASATELISLLGESGADPWADRVARGLQLIESGDRYGLDQILALYGGMGSLSDLVIHPMKHHPIPERRVDDVNERLNALRATLFSTARALQRRLNLPSTEP
jgi:hypothetical protein